MRKEMAMAILLLAMGAPALVAAAPQQAKSEQKPTFSAVLDRSVSGVEREFVPAAEAMPDDGHLLDLFMAWTPDQTARRRILVETPARLFGG